MPRTSESGSKTETVASDAIPDPCSLLALEQGCTCHMPKDVVRISTKEASVTVGRSSCPLHGEIPEGKVIWRNQRWEVSD
jgi:hypothetical protein